MLKTPNATTTYEKAPCSFFVLFVQIDTPAVSPCVAAIRLDSATASRPRRSLQRCGTRAAGASMNQHISVAVQGEAEGASEVDVSEVGRPDAAQPIVFDNSAILAQAINYAVHATRVPCQHDVGQQRMRARDRHHLVAPPPPLGRHLAGVDRPLQLVDRLAAVEQRVDLPAKLVDCQVVAQEEGAQESSQVLGRAVQRICRPASVTNPDRSEWAEKSSPTPAS